MNNYRIHTVESAPANARAALQQLNQNLGFVPAGFGHDQVLEVIAGLAVSVMANYAGNITAPVVEAPFAPQTWRP